MVRTFRKRTVYRQAVVPDLAWLSKPSPWQQETFDETSDIVHMSQWLKDAELPVAGVETSIADAKEQKNARAILPWDRNPCAQRNANYRPWDRQTL